MTLQNKTVLVTGGTGFIGSRVVEKLALEQGVRVRVLVRNFARAARIARLPIEMVAGDLLDETAVQKAVRGCEVVFHCAYDFSGDRERQRQVSAQGSKNIVEAVLHERASRMVYVSTFAVYAPMSDGDLTEASPWPNSKNAYVMIKRETERLLLHLHKNRGLPVVVVQPTLVYGPFSPHWAIATVQQLKSGLVPLINQGRGYCNPVYIDDLVDALILAAIKSNISGESFLISGEAPVTWREFYAAYENVIGIKSAIDITEEKLRSESQKRRQRPNTISRILTLVRHPEVLELLRTLPAVPTFVNLAKMLLSDDQWESIKSGQKNGIQTTANDGAAVQNIHIPDELMLGMYRSKVSVNIHKAKMLLGYSPQFDFERGMALTAHFIHWANLA
jgi:nucleoside-diphosphate-sugar epimerase